jgi:hypothetical protein
VLTEVEKHQNRNRPSLVLTGPLSTVRVEPRSQGDRIGPARPILAATDSRRLRSRRPRLSPCPPPVAICRRRPLQTASLPFSSSLVTKQDGPSTLADLAIRPLTRRHHVTKIQRRPGGESLGLSTASVIVLAIFH